MLHWSLFSCCLSGLWLAHAGQPGQGPARVRETRTEAGVRLLFSFPEPVVQRTADGVDVLLEGCEADEQAGAPVLPVYGIALDVPPGKQVARVRITPLETVSMPLDAPVRCGENALPLSTDPRSVARARPDRAIYGSRRPFPSHEAPRYRIDRQHGRDRLALALHPVQAVPAENRLLSHRTLAVELEWADIPAARSPARPRLKEAAAEVSNLGDGDPGGMPVVPLLLGPPTEGRLPPGTNEYVIVGDAGLMRDTPAPWDFTALLNSRRMAGLTATNVSVAWITATYTGADTPARIRAFVRDAYQTWGTRFVLLAGTHALVPSRQLYAAFSSYTAYIPSDGLYYGCLDGDFNYDGDSVYGELTDGVNGGDVDLLAEVSVGRFPIASTNEAARMIRKTLAYEAAATASLSRVTHVGEYLGFSGPADYATGMMEEIRLGSSTPYSTLGFENAEYGAFFDTSDTLYDSPTYTWPVSQMVNRLNGDFHVINHMGHGNYYYCFKMNLFLSTDQQAIANLTNSVFSLAYSQACDTGRFDDRSDCFAEQLVTTRAGAFAAVMNPRYGWGYQGSVDGPSQRFHRRFWDAVFSRGRYHLGVMNQDSKECNRYLVSSSSGDPWRWCYYEITLFGDPATPFAARVLHFPPAFTHTPLNNQFPSLAEYRVDCIMGPVSLYQPESPQLVWQTDANPGVIHTNPMTRIAGSRYEAAIPAQPLGTRISYHLLASTLAGVSGQSPAAGDYSFVVTEPYALTVAGQPSPYGTVTPPYGVSLIASGSMVSASAPLRVDVAPGVSQAATGWTGDGSVPGAGTSNALNFVMGGASTLNWQWATEFELRQQSSVTGLIASNSWHRPGARVTSLIAPDTQVRTGVTYVFCGWYLDGGRQPAAPARVDNPVIGVEMTTNRCLSALYLPGTLDQDGNGLPDWWEYSYFGTNGIPADADSDGDGFDTLDEYRDRTNPSDSASHPTPPDIQHVPLASPQRVPPPYTVSAILTDSYTIASAELRWRRNDESWQTAAFTSQGAGVFSGVVPAPGEPADTFEYAIVAADPIGQAATAGVYSVFLQYPRLSITPQGGRDLVLLPTGTDHALITLTNRGNARLNWSLAAGSLEIVTPGAAGWNTNAWGQSWMASTARSYSPPYAFFAHLTSGGLQVATPAVHACLDSPPLQLAPAARLVFRYWAKTELDVIAGYCYDGGIVEISTNGGVSFAQLPGPYTHRLHGWLYSPWVHNTPCFAGDGTAGWTEAAFDLAAYAGQSVIIRFHYGADNNTDDEGWYVDDIRVGPLASAVWPDWAICGALSGSLSGGAQMSFPFDTDAAAATSRNERLSVHVMSNDPVAPNTSFDWTLKIREPPRLAAVQAQQTSTNGEGLVTISFRVADADGEDVDVQIEYSSDGGAVWLPPVLTGATATLGLPPAGVATGALPCLATADAQGPATNAVTALWPTQLPSPGITLANVQVRLLAANPYFSSGFLLPPPFVVDNQPPDDPAGLALSHPTQAWSTVTAFHASWQPCSDGGGIGGVAYRRRLAADTLPPEPPVSPATSFDGTMPESGDIWFAVQAVDAFGNAGSVVQMGPFQVDATPPVANAARVWAVASDSGDYAVGTNVTVAWGGFYDLLSGVAGYRVRNLASPEIHTATDSAIFLAAEPVDETNRFSVAAVDRAGNVSAALTVQILVLDPLADPDGDGLITRDEEIAGTDALASGQRFRTSLSDEINAWFVTWPGRAGRTYTVERTPVLQPAAWAPLPPFIDIPGSNGLMRASVPQDATAAFFRVRVTR